MSYVLSFGYLNDADLAEHEIGGDVSSICK